MKKILFGTTALLAAGAFVSTAQASDPIKLSVGGYMEEYVVFADQDSDYTANSVNSFDVQSDSEIFFKGKTTLDNGMTIGADVQLEASGSAGANSAGDDTIDESYLWVSGKYGKMILGAENSAAYLMFVGAPGVSVLGKVGQETDVDAFLMEGVDNIEVINKGSQDAPKVTYFTPKMYGLQAGVSYTPSGDTDGDENQSNIQRNGTWDDAWAFGLKYDAKFEGVGIKASATYEIMDYNAAGAAVSGVNNQDNELQNIGGGLNISYMGFTVGGGVRRQIANANTGLADKDGFAWNAGVMYKEGPYGVSVDYYKSEVQGDTVADDGRDDELSTWQLSGTYKLGAGVTLFADVAYSDSDDDSQTAVPADNDGAIGGAMGLKLNF